MAKEKKISKGYSRLELILLLCIALVVIFLAIPIYNSWYGERQPIAYPDPEQKEVDPWNSGNEEKRHGVRANDPTHRLEGAFG